MLFRSNDTATTEIYTEENTLSLHDALPICRPELVVETLTPLLDGDESRLMVAAQDDSLAWQAIA